MEINIHPTHRKLLNVVLGFFAVVGFLASAVTVLQFFRSEQVAALEVAVTQQEFLVPQYAAAGMESGAPARVLATELRDEFCQVPGDEEVLRTKYADIPNKFGDKAEAAKTCKEIQDIEFAGRWAGQFSEYGGALYRYEITNVGREVARGIRLRADGLNSVQVTSGDGKYAEIQKGEEERFFVLPDLNPRESYNVYAWSQSYHDIEYREWSDLPQVTYTGSGVDVEFMKPVPDGWYDLYDFLFGMSWVFAVLVLLVVSFAVTFAFFGVVGLIQSAVTGQPLSEIFSQKGSSKSGDLDGGERQPSKTPKEAEG